MSDSPLLARLRFCRGCNALPPSTWREDVTVPISLARRSRWRRLRRRARNCGGISVRLLKLRSKWNKRVWAAESAVGSSMRVMLLWDRSRLLMCGVNTAEGATSKLLPSSNTLSRAGVSTKAALDMFEMALKRRSRVVSCVRLTKSSAPMWVILLPLSLRCCT